jgi:hypothetical protein
MVDCDHLIKAIFGKACAVALSGVIETLAWLIELHRHYRSGVMIDTTKPPGLKRDRAVDHAF